MGENVVGHPSGAKLKAEGCSAASMASRREAGKPSKKAGRRRWDRRRVLIVVLAVAIVVTFVVSALAPIFQH